MKERLDLNGIKGLNEEVAGMIPSLIQGLGEDPQCVARLTVKIDFRAQPDSGLRIEYRIRQEFPARSMLARRDLVEGVEFEESTGQLPLFGEQPRNRG